MIVGLTSNNYSDFQVNEPHFYISRIRAASRREGAFAERLAEKAQRREESFFESERNMTIHTTIQQRE